MNRTSSEREALAIAYLTGQAGEAEVREFEKLAETDPEFRTLVVELKSWLAPLESTDPEPLPPEGLLDEILAGIASGPSQVRVVAAQATRTVHWAWRPTALIAAAFALAAVVYPTFNSSPAALSTLNGVNQQNVERNFVAALSGDSDAQVIVIVYDATEHRILARYSNVAPPVEGVWQLWLIRDGTPAPRSLGLLREQSSGVGQSELTFDEDLLPESDLLAISLEPAGGSPGEGPTGPVLFTGTVSGLS